MSHRIDPLRTNPAWSALLWLAPAMLLMALALAAEWRRDDGGGSQQADEQRSPESPPRAELLPPGTARVPSAAVQGSAGDAPRAAPAPSDPAQGA